MKKKIIKIITAVLAASMLIACGQNETVVSQSSTLGTVSGKTADVGRFSVLCPNGWNVMQTADEESSSSQATADENETKLIKGGSTEEDLLYKPYINVIVYTADQGVMQIDPDEWYDNVTRLDDFTTGDYTWSGYSATSLGISFVYVSTEYESNTIEAYLYTREGDEASAAITDVDVLAILQSISVK